MLFLVEISSDAIKPAVRIRTHHRELDGERVLLVEVPQSESQHDSPGGSYVRVGGSKRRMTSDERLRLAQRRGQARFLWFDKQPVPETGFPHIGTKRFGKPLLSAEGRADPENGTGKKMGLLGTRRTQHGASDRRRPSLFAATHAEEWLPNACITAHPLPRQ